MSDDEERQDPIDDALRRAGLDPDQVRDWINGAGEWLKEQLGAATVTGNPRPGVPDPLDMPTHEQGAALAALDSGRWTIDPETSALASDGDGPPPEDALGAALELRVRDWIDANGALTTAGRAALTRWVAKKS